MSRTTKPDKKPEGKTLREVFGAEPDDVDLILCSDLHLREDQPACRTDDHWEAQAAKVLWLGDLQYRTQAPILCSGDVFHYWKPSPNLLRWAIESLPRIICIPGQHDLPQHSLDLYPRSGLAVLEEAGTVRVLKPSFSHLSLSEAVETCDLERRKGRDFAIQAEIWGFPFGTEPDANSGLKRLRAGGFQIAMIHELVWAGKPPFPGAPEAGNVRKVIERLADRFNLIVSGDNHKTFEMFEHSASLVNPGSMMRMTADQMGHKPCVFLIKLLPDGEFSCVSEEFPIIPAEQCMTREHIDVTARRDERMEAFIGRLQGEFETGLSFVDNLKQFFDANPDIRRPVRELVWQAVEEGG